MQFDTVVAQEKKDIFEQGRERARRFREQQAQQAPRLDPRAAHFEASEAQHRQRQAEHAEYTARVEAEQDARSEASSNWNRAASREDPGDQMAAMQQQLHTLRAQENSYDTTPRIDTSSTFSRRRAERDYNEATPLRDFTRGTPSYGRLTMHERTPTYGRTNRARMREGHDQRDRRTKRHRGARVRLRAPDFDEKEEPAMATPQQGRQAFKDALVARVGAERMRRWRAYNLPQDALDAVNRILHIGERQFDDGLGLGTVQDDIFQIIQQHVNIPDDEKVDDGPAVIAAQQAPAAAKSREIPRVRAFRWNAPAGRINDLPNTGQFHTQFLSRGGRHETIVMSAGITVEVLTNSVIFTAKTLSAAGRNNITRLLTSHFPLGGTVEKKRYSSTSLPRVVLQALPGRVSVRH